MADFSSSYFFPNSTIQGGIWDEHIILHPYHYAAADSYTGYETLMVDCLSDRLERRGRGIEFAGMEVVG